MHRKIFVTVILFSVFAACSFNNKSNPPLSINQTVQLYADTYGTARMDETAEIVTENFRDGKPVSVWVADSWKALQQLEYEKLETKILSTKIKYKHAIVIADGKIRTKAGETRHKEIYILKRVNGRWLIDELRITDEDISMPEVEI